MDFDTYEKWEKAKEILVLILGTVLVLSGIIFVLNNASNQLKEHQEFEKLVFQECKEECGIENYICRESCFKVRKLENK